MKSLDDVKKALETVADGADLYEAVVSAVQGEKDKGIEEARKLRKEAKAKGDKAKRLADAVKDLGFNVDDEDADLDAFLTEVQDKIEAGKDGGKAKGKLTETEKANRELAKQVETLTKQFQSAEAEKTALAEKQKTQKMTETLKKAFAADDGSSTIYGADAEIRCLIADGKVRLEDDGETVVFVEGDDSVKLQDGITKFKESRPDVVRNIQRAGPGTNPGGPNAGGGKETDVERLARLRNLSAGPTIRFAN